MTKKKQKPLDDSSVLNKTEHNQKISKKRGRPENKIPKVQAQFYLPEEIKKAIDIHCMGNRSVFAENVFKYYFESHDIKY